jgi:hypothetical protein
MPGNILKRYIVTIWGCVTINGVWNGYRNYTLQITDTQISALSLLQSPLAVSWQRLLAREILQLPPLRSSRHSRPCRTLCQLTTQLTGSQAGDHFTPTSWSSLHRLTSKLTTELSLTEQLLHVTSLNWTAHNSKVKVTLPAAVYRQSIRLGVKPFEIHDQFLSPTEALR